MAKVVQGKESWSAVICCAHPTGFFGLHRVDGCFAEIEITLNDFHGSRDWEGDWSLWVNCPACGQKLYPEWQIGKGPLEIVKKRILREKGELS